MTGTILSKEQLNRTLLHRQLLLERHDLSVEAAVERLIALESQVHNPPYIGLWTRLRDFERDELDALQESRRLKRTPWIRSTLHLASAHLASAQLVSASDYQRFQEVIRSGLLSGLRSSFGEQVKELDIEGLVRMARAFIEAEEPSVDKLLEYLQEREPTVNQEALDYAMNSCLPLARIPLNGTWGSSVYRFYKFFSFFPPAENWLGHAQPSDLSSLFRRYLSAFGPASIMDFQTWTGMTGLKSLLGPTLAELRLYHSEDGEALYDLPGLPIIDAGVEAPIRFLPEYDNILIAHRDRSRMKYRKKVFRSSGRRVTGAILIDGFVGGRWSCYRNKSNHKVFSWRIYKEQPEEREEEIEAERDCLWRFIEDTYGGASGRYDVGG